MKYGVIFDMDGTLFDTGEGIKACVRHAAKAVGKPPIPEDKLDTFIGPSLYHSFSVTVGYDEQTTQDAVDAYRARYFAEGLIKSRPYDGVEEMLKELQEAGMALSIASSKPLVMVEKLLELFDLGKYFLKVCAPDYAKRTSDKSELISEACVAQHSVMVGDTRFDIEGAHKAGIPAIAVTYGYGAADTLTSADAFAETPAKVAEIAKCGEIFHRKQN